MGKTEGAGEDEGIWWLKENAVLLDLKIEEEAMSQGMHWLQL